MKKDTLKYILAIVIYGTIGYFLRFISFPSEIVVICRGTFGAFIVWLFVRLRGRKPDKAAIRKNLGWLLFSGICLGLNWVFLFAAYMRTTLAIASLCNYLAPVILVVLAPFLYREKLSRKKLLCVAAAVVGVVLITVFKPSEGAQSGVWGIVFAILAALGFVGLIIGNRKIKDVNPYDKAIIQLAVSALTVLPYVLIRNLGTPIPFDLRSCLLTLMLGVFHTGFAYCLYFDSLGKLPVHTVAVFGYLEPVTMVLCSVLLLGETMLPLAWVGAFLILGAAVASELIKE